MFNYRRYYDPYRWSDYKNHTTKKLKKILTKNAQIHNYYKRIFAPVWKPHSRLKTAGDITEFTGYIVYRGLPLRFNSHNRYLCQLWFLPSSFVIVIYR